MTPHILLSRPQVVATVLIVLAGIEASVSTAFVLFVFAGQWATGGKTLNNSISWIPGLVLAHFKICSLLLFMLALRHVSLTVGSELPSHTESTWQYLLHLELVSQCILLLLQTGLCLFQQPRKVKGASYHHTSEDILSCSQLNDNAVPRTRTQFPQVFVIVPCYHEESRVLEKMLNSVSTSCYPHSKIKVYLSFDGLPSTEELRHVQRLLGLPEDLGHDEKLGKSYETSFRGCHLRLSIFDHGGKRHCQQLTFDLIKTQEEALVLADSCILLLDSDSFLQEDCISAFVEKMSDISIRCGNLGAVAGLTRVFDPGHSLLLFFQRLEYCYAQHFERKVETACGAVHCLPGGLTFVTYAMLERIAPEYFEDTTSTNSTNDNLFDYARKFLGEDRWFTQLTLNQDGGKGGIRFCRDASCDTVAPDTMLTFLKQRRRWFLGCLANQTSGISDLQSWKQFPALSSVRLLNYSLETPNLPHVLLVLLALNNTIYVWRTLMMWLFATLTTWITLIITARQYDLLAALFYPCFIAANPVVLMLIRIYSIFTMNKRTWGSRSSPPAPRESTIVRTQKCKAAAPITRVSEVENLTVDLRDYLSKTNVNCAPRFVSILGKGSQVGDVTCVIFDSIAVARKHASSRRSTAARAIQREVRALTGLNHNHIISVVKCSPIGSIPEIYLWPVATCDLLTFLLSVHDAHQNGNFHQDFWLTLGLIDESDSIPSLTAADAWLSRFVGCLCTGVAYIHSRGIRHGDIRPENILITPRGPILADFGYSQRLQTGENKSDSNFGHRKIFSADILQLGCVLLELTSAINHLVPHAKDINVMTDLSRTYEWNFVTNLHERTVWTTRLYAISDGTHTGVLKIVEQMLHKNPVRRPTALAVVQNLIDLDSDNRLFGHCCMR